MNVEYCMDHIEDVAGHYLSRKIPLNETDLSIHQAVKLENNGLIEIEYNSEGYAILHLL